MDLALIPEQNLLQAGALPYGDLVRFAMREGRRPRPRYAVKGTGGTQVSAVHYFWAQVVACPSCKKAGEAHPNYILAEEAGQRRWAFCRKCHEPHSLKTTQRSFACTSCEAKTVLDSA